MLNEIAGALIKAVTGGAKLGWKSGGIISNTADPRTWGRELRKVASSTARVAGHLKPSEIGNTLVGRPANWLNRKAGEFTGNFGHYARGNHAPRAKMTGMAGVGNRLWNVSDAVFNTAWKTAGNIASLPLRAAGTAAVALPIAAVRGTHGLLKSPLWFGAKGGLYGIAGRTGLALGKEVGQGLWNELRFLNGGTARGVVNAGKFMWTHRNRPTLQVAQFGALAGGATMLGVIEGNEAAQIGRVLPLDDFQMTFSSPQPILDQTVVKPQFDDLSATGDLVFALNNLRKGGYVG